MERAYGTSGSAPFHPHTSLRSILVYGYATGVFSSRKRENATYGSVAFLFETSDRLLVIFHTFWKISRRLGEFRQRRDIEVLIPSSII